MTDAKYDYFDRRMAQRGYALNKMCYSFNDAAARTAFQADPAGYCDRFGLSAEEREAVLSRDRRRIIAAGGNMYFFQKFERIPRAPEGGQTGASGAGA